jgi:Uma2 family endonuclease
MAIFRNEIIESNAMSTIVTVPLSEYLDTIYRPDCEYIDGELRERNLGETDHSRCQVRLSSYLFSQEGKWGIVVFTEQRVQVKATRFRVPDICVVTGPLPATPILLEPPFLCIEILSREDRMYDMQEKIDDYLAFGVPHVWVINPRQMRAFHYTIDGMREAKDGILQTSNPDIVVPLLQLDNP